MVVKLLDPKPELGAAGVLQRIRPRLAKLEGVRLAGFEFRIDKDPKRQREPATYTLRDVDRERG